MRNVLRGSKPKSLDKNATTWTEELLSAIERAEKDGNKVPERFYNKYNKKDVRDALETMYGRRCCYCEAPVKVVTKGEIEHRKPKRGVHAFPESTFDWNNLHLVCPECNSAKGSKWNPTDEILDATGKKLIPKHLSYEIEDTGIHRKALSRDGTTTICHAKLNRDDLVKARIKILLGVLQLLKKIDEMADDPNVPIKKQVLQDKRDGDYGTLIGWAIEEYGWSIV